MIFYVETVIDLEYFNEKVKEIHQHQKYLLSLKILHFNLNCPNILDCLMWKWNDLFLSS